MAPSNWCKEEMMEQQVTLIRAPLKAPRAGAIAGIVFALLLIAALVLLRLAAMSGSTYGPGWFTDVRLSLPLRLVPFAGIAFLWFIGVVRDRIGEHEDQFFATVFLGSGLLFVAMLFVASGVGTGVLFDAVARPGGATDSWTLGRKTAAIIMHTYAMRMAAVFTVSTATIGFRTGFIPRWLGLSGYAIAVILLLGIDVTLWVEVLFPFWILLLSLHILVKSFNGSQGNDTRGASP
jgi:hypothetical protein